MADPPLSDGSAAADRRDRREITTDAIAIGVATGAYGISFGALAVTNGFSLVQAQALSVLMFTGASQFAAVAIVGAGGGALAGIATAWLLGSRNGLYALSLDPTLRPRGWQRPLAAQLTIDESTAMAVAHEEDPRGWPARYGFWATGLAVFVLWNLGTLVGAAGAGSGKVESTDSPGSLPGALLWRFNASSIRSSKESEI